METDIVTFWFLVLSCVSGLIVVATRLRSAALGWVGIYLGILVLASIGWIWGKPVLIYAGLAIWLLLILLPGLLSRLYHRYFLQHRFSKARRVGRIISWLHPADGWRQ